MYLQASQFSSSVRFVFTLFSFRVVLAYLINLLTACILSIAWALMIPKWDSDPKLCFHVFLLSLQSMYDHIVFVRVLTLGEVFRDGWRHVQSHTRLDIRHLSSKHFVQQEAKLPCSCLCTKEKVMRVEFWRAVVLGA